MKSVLVTGGAGYIGSHTVRELAGNDYHPIVLDHLKQGHAEAVPEGELIVGDLADAALLDSIFDKEKVDGVVHFAGLCYVGESVSQPGRYYEENVGNGLTLLQVMRRHGVKKFVFSSSCAVYGDPLHLPIEEDHPKNPVNPYGESKCFIESILRQYDRAYGLRSVSLRYFNAAGASLDARLGESHEPEPHLIPRVLRAAQGEIEKIEIYGDDYPTRDGSCVRDYIHVQDLAIAHVAAYRWLDGASTSENFNLGTGKGYSVKEVIAEASRVTGQNIPSEVRSRRPGDPPELVADGRKAARLLGWKPQHSELKKILSTAWTWERNRKY